MACASKDEGLCSVQVFGIRSLSEGSQLGNQYHVQVPAVGGG